MKFFGLVSLLLSTAIAQPFANDECIGAKVIPQTSPPFSENVNIVTYTNNVADPIMTCNGVNATDGKTLWYKYTPAVDGVLSFATDGLKERFIPGLDIILGVFTGSCGNLAEVKCSNRFDSFTTQESVYPTVRGGVSYYIKVGEASTKPFGSGMFNLTVLFEPKSLTIVGNECTGAKIIPHGSLPLNEIVDTRLYSNNLNDKVTTCSKETGNDGNDGNEGNTIWYKYTPPFDGIITVSTRGSVDVVFGGPLDNLLGVFTGNCNGLTQVLCVDKGSEETLSYPVKSGVTYTVKLGEFGDGGTGLGLVNFTFSFQRNYFNLIREDEGLYSSYLQSFLNGIFNGNAESGFAGRSNVISLLSDLDYSSINTSALAIEATFTQPNSVRSVMLKLDNRPAICENYIPYKISGPLSIGNRLIDATAYSQSFCRGRVLGKISQNFVVTGCNFVQYGLYDADRDTYVTNLYNASTVSSPPCNLNIGVAFQCGFKPKTVRFELRRASNNALVLRRDESSAPYFLFSNLGNNILSGSIPAGEYILSAIIDGIAHPSVRFTFGVCKRSNNVVDNTFDIDLRFSLGDLSTYPIAQKFPPIVKRISSLIIGDKPDFVVSLRITYFSGFMF
jgi:hypothetical protein